MCIKCFATLILQVIDTSTPMCVCVFACAQPQMQFLPAQYFNCTICIQDILFVCACAGSWIRYTQSLRHATAEPDAQAPAQLSSAPAGYKLPLQVRRSHSLVACQFIGCFKYRWILISITSTAWFESMLGRCSVLCVWLQTFVHHWHCWRANLLWRRYSRHWPKRSRGHWRAHQVIWAQGRLGHEVGQCKCSRFDVTVLCVCACIASIY